MQTLSKFLLCGLLGFAALGAQAETRAVIDTNMGQIRLSLDEQKAPKSVENFVNYANKGFYNGTIFHRVMDGFMIQGGGFYNLTGTVAFDPKAQTGSVDVRIPVSSLNTGNARFDEHLKSADLFNAAQYPEMRFQSSKWHFKGNKVSSVEGTLTLLGQTHPVTLKATKFNCYNSPMLKTEVCGGDFETVIDRSKWGMNYLVAAGMSKNVKLNIQIEAAKQ